MRIGVIGARQARQGIGFHLARFLAAEGADVVGIVGTSRETAEEARGALAAIDVDTRAYADVQHLLEKESPSALVIASPSRTHEAYLRLALGHGLHVLCEKPLCWGGPDAVGASRELVEAFSTRGLHLVVNAQWPYTLETYGKACPDVALDRPPSFRMRLSPRSVGSEMIPDAIPHALSLLAAVLPDPAASVTDVAIEVLGAEEDHLLVRFEYRALGRSVPATVELKRKREQPRPVGYGFGACQVRRHVDLRGYRLSFEGPAGRVDLPDPTPRLVRAFLSRVSSSAPALPDPAAWPAMAHLQAVAAAWDDRTRATAS